jgi:hypothetical protein
VPDQSNDFGASQLEAALVASIKRQLSVNHVGYYYLKKYKAQAKLAVVISLVKMTGQYLVVRAGHDEKDRWLKKVDPEIEVHPAQIYSTLVREITVTATYAALKKRGLLP